MASGNTIWALYPFSVVGPSANFATLDIVADASTPAFDIPVLDFDGAADEHADFVRQVPSQYAGGGFTWEYSYAMDGTDGDLIDLELRIVTLADASSVLTADLGVDTATASSLQDDPSATANQFNESGTAALTHSNAGSPAIGGYVLIRITRDISAAANGDDAQVQVITIKET